MDQKTFWREKTQPKTKSYITWGILGGVFLCVTSLLSTSIYGAAGLLDVVLTAGLTLGIALKQSRACAVILLVIFVVSKAFAAYFTPIDVLSVILIAVIGYTLVCGMLGTFAFRKEWRAHCEGKTLPPGE